MNNAHDFIAQLPENLGYMYGMLSIWLADFPSAIARYIQSDPWLIFGFAAQLMFMMRFIIQWYVSEKMKRSVMPVSFWVFSLVGGSMLLSYVIIRQDPALIAGQALGLIIYSRNLYFIFANRAMYKTATPLEQAHIKARELADRLKASRGYSADIKQIQDEVIALQAVISDIRPLKASVSEETEEDEVEPLFSGKLPYIPESLKKPLPFYNPTGAEAANEDDLRARKAS